MKILDSNKDFYDFYQNIYIDNTLVFDRRDSYNLSKKEFADNFTWQDERYWHPRKRNVHFILLQVGYNYWLFEAEMTKKSDTGIFCTDYELSLIGTLKKYNMPAKAIELSEINFSYYIKNTLAAVQSGEFDVIKVFNSFRLYKGDYDKCEIKHIPILKNLGIASLVEPLNIYLALEEYFIHKKTESERTEPIGMTNDDKIIEHGFDTKISFRGKNS